ncbi:MAG: SMP-30/gluconolactonase/LRE family protein [Rikenellaceae bacterium]
MKRKILGIVALAMLAHFSSAQSRMITEENLFTTNMESPAVDASGNIYVVNYKTDGTIGKVKPNGTHELFVTLPSGMVGNGIRIDNDGNLLVADFSMHNVLKVNVETKEVSVVAHNDKMNQPNDLTYSRKTGNIYTSDPNWKNDSGQLWLVRPNGESVLVWENMGTTNGIELSPDEKYLYVNESRQLNLWRFNINNDGTLTGKKLLYKFKGYGLDGMKCDKAGNIYVSRYAKGEILVLSPKGKEIKSYTTIGKKTSNICLTADEKQAYVTLQDTKALECIELK